MVMPYRQDNDEPTIFIGMLKLIVNWAGALLSIIILITLIIWGFSLNVSDSAEIPVVKAKIKELRVVSEEPGGQIVNYQGLSVNNVQEQGSAQSAATRIILAPEPIELIEEDINISIIENSRVANEPKVSSLNNGDEENKKEIINVLDGFAPFAVVISVIPKIRNLYGTHSLDKIIENNDVDLTPGTEDKFIENNDVELTPGTKDKIKATNEVSLKSGTNLVQLGFYSTKQKAQKVWSDLMINNSSVFKNKKRIIQNVNIRGNNSYRLTVVGFSGLGESKDFCLFLRDSLPTCLPMRAK
jgi:hypothetical protein